MNHAEELLDFAEECGHTVDYFMLNRSESLALRDSDGCHIAVNPFMIRSSADETCKLAHELGHCERGAFYNRYSPFDLIEKQERRADAWAIQRLIPRADLEAALADHREVWELPDLFGVTPEFIAKALRYYFPS